MNLMYSLIGFFVIKGLMLWPFYNKQKWLPLVLGLASSLALAPLLTLLYHETDANFGYIYLGMIVLDVLLYCLLLQRTWWKAALISFFLNTVVFVYFLIGNG